MPRNRIVLYTVQSQGQDITVQCKSPSENAKDQAAYVELARYLGWNSWIWAFSDLKDFKNEWMTVESLVAGDLWILSVPRESIKWCGLAGRYRDRGSIRTWFYPNPEAIKKAGDTPQGLIKVPVLPTWVSEKTSAKEAFIKAGLWQEGTQGGQKASSDG